MSKNSYSSMGLSGEERGYTEKRIRAGEKPAPTIKLQFVWIVQAKEGGFPNLWIRKDFAMQDAKFHRKQGCEVTVTKARLVYD